MRENHPLDSPGHAPMVKRPAKPAAASHRVRIIGGRWRGTRVSVPSGTGARPTSDRVRETLFNWLGPAIEGTRCLDLFAGTGVLGLEALSRGADEVVFVDSDRRLTVALRAQLDRLGGRAEVVQADTLKWLQRGAPGTSGASGPFDIVFLDPPYAMPAEPLLRALPAWLSSGALIYLERAREPGLPDAPDGMRWHRTAAAAGVAYGLLAVDRVL
jgi:16S rRNA (guanine966-N2)-methyltransferase